MNTEKQTEIMQLEEIATEMKAYGFMVYCIAHEASENGTPSDETMEAAASIIERGLCDLSYKLTDLMERQIEEDSEDVED